MSIWMPSALPKGHKELQADGTGRASRGRELQLLLLLHLLHGEAGAASVLQYLGVFSTCKCAAGNGHRCFGHSWTLPCSACFAGELGMDKRDGNRKELKKKKWGEQMLGMDKSDGNRKGFKKKIKGSRCWQITAWQEKRGRVVVENRS